jgi:hypothetical protein
MRQMVACVSAFLLAVENRHFFFYSFVSGTALFLTSSTSEAYGYLSIALVVQQNNLICTLPPNAAYVSEWLPNLPTWCKLGMVTSLACSSLILRVCNILPYFYRFVMNAHKCEHCQPFLLDLCDPNPKDLSTCRRIRIDCRNNATTYIPIKSFDKVGKGKCAFIDFLAEMSTSDEVRTWSGYIGQRLRFGSDKKVLFALTAKPGMFISKA